MLRFCSNSAVMLIAVLASPLSLPAADEAEAIAWVKGMGGERKRDKTAEVVKAVNDAYEKSKSPRAVVARWLELHRTGKRAEASALTNKSPYLRADVLLPSSRDTGVRVQRSLDNQRVAAVVTNSLKEGSEEVLLFWLVRRDGAWRINKSDSFERRVVDERLRGFLEAGDVRWHVQRDQLLGHWEADPCKPPGNDGVTACGSRLQLGDDNRYRLLSWGPGAPDPEDVIRGKWRVANGRILLSHQDRTYECPVTWMDRNRLEIESADGKIRAVYERTTADQARKP